MTNNRSRLLLLGGILLVVGLLALFVPIAILLLAIGRVDDAASGSPIGVDPIGVVIGAVVGFGCFAAGSVILVRAALPPRSGQ